MRRLCPRVALVGIAAGAVAVAAAACGKDDPGPIATMTPEEVTGFACQEEHDDPAAHLPEPVRDDAIEPAIEHAIGRYENEDIGFERNLAPYRTDGDYLNWGEYRTYGVGQEMQYDDRDIPMINYGGDYEYNPLTVAQYALTMHGRYVRGGDEADRERFLEVVDGLLRLQDEDGAFRYNFEWQYHLADEPFEPGWVSGMGQGVALSALARAYHETGDKRYIEAGNRALEFMVTPIAAGGTMTTLNDLAGELDSYLFIAEYPHDPDYYTLNGFMYAMLGLHDWTHAAEGSDAGEMAERILDCSMETLELILPLYDVGGFTAYDLAHIMRGVEHTTLNPHYHAVHIALLHALDSIEPNEVFQETMEQWKGYVATR